MTVVDVGAGVLSIETADTSITNLPLREFCVKSSFNSACTGSYMNVLAVTYVLSRGCRFLDFEVYLINDVLCVGVSTNPLTGSQNITSSNTIPLDTALRQVIASGFSAPSPNANDPIFVRIRLQVAGTDTVTSGVYKKASMVIQTTLGNRLYSGLVTSDTLLSSLMSTVVLVWDKTSSPGYITEPALTALVNIESGGDSMRTFTNKSISTQSLSPPHIHDDNLTSDVVLIRSVSPDNTERTTINPINTSLISEHGVQYVCNRFYITDANLTSYEKFFKYNRYAFIPFSQAIPYAAISQ